MSLLKKITNQITLFTSVFIFLIIIIVYFLNSKIGNTDLGCGTTTPVLFCGNVTSSSPNAAEGKKLFNSNCAACHKLDKVMTGPALRGISESYKYPYENYLFDFITKEDSLINISDSFTISINKKFKFETEYMHNSEFTKTEIEYLLEYLK